MIWIAYFAGVVTLPALAGIAAAVYSALRPTRKWSGCGTCSFWTTSLVPIVRWMQFEKHYFWGRLTPKRHAAYGQLHPPRREPPQRETEYIDTDELLGQTSSRVEEES